jgi:hypothetical protein
VGPETARLRDLANVSLARTFYSTGQFDLAAKYYARISPESVYWRDRLFETGWTDYRRANYAAALADVGALRAAGAVPPELMGEATLLESAAAFEAGDQERGASALAAFNAKYPPMFAELKSFLAANPDDGALYARVAALRRGKSDLSPPVDEVVRCLLLDPAIAGRLEDVDELAREVASEERLSARSEPGERGFDQVVSADLTARLSNAIKEAGSITRRRIKRVTEELGQQIRRTIHIDYEPLHAALVR